MIWFPIDKSTMRKTASTGGTAPMPITATIAELKAKQFRRCRSLAKSLDQEFSPHTLYFSWRPDVAGRRRISSDPTRDRKSTRLNSSHVATSYAVFCLKKKTHAAPAPVLPPEAQHQLAKLGIQR